MARSKGELLLIRFRTETDESSSFTSPVKRAKDEPDVQTSHWQPDRLSSLSNLIKETKALLA